jgi:hypothetical protein
LLAVLFLLGATLVVAGCGSQSDKFAGTWIQKSLPGSSPETPLTIKKVGDEYSLTGPGGETNYGYVLHTTPTASGHYTLYSMVLNATKATKDGDKLKFSVASDTIEIAVSGDTMTMTVPSAQGVFTFSRVAAQGGT